MLLSVHRHAETQFEITLCRDRPLTVDVLIDQTTTRIPFYTSTNNKAR